MTVTQSPLKVVLVGLGEAVPLETEEAQLVGRRDIVADVPYSCATCGATRSVRKVGPRPSVSGAGVDVYGCPDHAPALAAEVDDILPDLEWLLARRPR
ncbi:hypothetical protein ACFXKG_31105 [Streptomyces sp. NPDC059255]|uniref:hypothetical protein n=1 Tax=Streptomyces sp. NPDC059255 TaxID=3346793 RepID=UPI0036B71464